MLQIKVPENNAHDEETWKPICHIQMSHIVLRWEAFQSACLPFKLEGGVFCNWEQMGKGREKKHPNPLSYWGVGARSHHILVSVICYLYSQAHASHCVACGRTQQQRTPCLNNVNKGKTLYIGQVRTWWAGTHAEAIHFSVFRKVVYTLTLGTGGKCAPFPF